MKKLYFFVIISLILFSGCSKDVFKRYDERIVGQWRISDINRVGIGGNSSALAFQEGHFVFNPDGGLVYTDANGTNFNGSWEIQKREVNDETIRTLHITAIDFNSQLVRSEFYDDINFRSTNHFVAKIQQSLRTYVTHFRR